MTGPHAEREEYIVAHGNQAGHALAAEVCRPDQASRPHRRHQDRRHPLGHVQLAETHAETVGEHQHLARREIAANLVAEDFGLKFVGQQHGDDVGPPGGLGGRNRLEAVLDRLLVIRRFRQFGHNHLAAAIAEVLRLGVALRAVAQNGDGLAGQQRKIGVLVGVDFRGHNGLIWIYDSWFPIVPNPNPNLNHESQSTTPAAPPAGGRR